MSTQGAFWSQTQGAVKLSDVTEGIIKSGVFGAACSLVAVYEGYHAAATAEGVGLATTAHRGHFLGAGAAARLHAHGRIPNHVLNGFAP